MNSCYQRMCVANHSLSQNIWWLLLIRWLDSWTRTNLVNVFSEEHRVDFFSKTRVIHPERLATRFSALTTWLHLACIQEWKDKLSHQTFGLIRLKPKINKWWWSAKRAKIRKNVIVRCATLVECWFCCCSGCLMKPYLSHKLLCMRLFSWGSSGLSWIPWFGSNRRSFSTTPAACCRSGKGKV